MRFTITRAAPLERARRGSPLAGATRSEEPRTRRRPQLPTRSTALSHGSRGSASPKKTASGLSIPPHPAQRGGVLALPHPLHRLFHGIDGPATETRDAPRAAVKLADVQRTRLRVKAVDVLGDDASETAVFFETGERQVGGVRPRRGPRGPGFHGVRIVVFGILRESREGNDRLVHLLPETRSGRAVVGYSGFRAYARAGEGDCVFGPLQKPEKKLDLLFHDARAKTAESSPWTRPLRTIL